jgi:hypothetical protein
VQWAHDVRLCLAISDCFAKLTIVQINIVRGRTKAGAAKELGIPVEEVKPEQYDAVVLHGETLQTMTENQWAEVRFTLQSIATCPNMCHVHTLYHAHAHC